MKCYRHKTTELENGVCPECGWQNSSTTSIHVETGFPTLSAATTSNGTIFTTTEWKATPVKVIKTKPGAILPKETKKKGKK